MKQPNMKTIFPPLLTRWFTAPALAVLFSARVFCVQAAADPWQALPQYRFGQSREPLATIEEQIRKSDASERAAMEARLLEMLQSPAATSDSRRFICRWLGLVGTQKSVGPLAQLLKDAELSHPARIALEALPGAAADKALTDALPAVKGNLLAGVISSIGSRRVPEAVPQLSNLLSDTDPAVVSAALAALGEIGNEAASRALAAAEVSPALRRDQARARISAASRLAESGNRVAASAVFRDLTNSSQPPAIRVAGFQGLAGTLADTEAAALIIDTLEGDDSLLRPAALKAFANAGNARGTVAARLPSMQPRGQLLLLGILADAPDVDARIPLLKVADAAPDAAVKAAAIECLAVHGRAEDVALVAGWAATGEAPVKVAARRTLQRISGDGVDAAFIRIMESAGSSQRKVVMEALPGRRMEAALPTLSRLVRGTDIAVATEAAKTIGLMGSPAQLKDLAQVLTGTRNDDVRNAAQEAIKTICTRSEDKAACTAVIESELAAASTPEVRAALLPITVFTGGEPGLNQVLKAMQDPNAEVRAAAFSTLVSWPEARAADPLLRFAETNSEAGPAIVALRDGCLRLAEMEEVAPAERASILRGVVRVARRPEEKKRAISLMGQVPALELLEFLANTASDPGLRAEALTATLQLARNLASVYPRQSLAALDTVERFADSPESDLRTGLANARKAVRNAGQSPEGFILGWMVSGPYTEADQDAGGLFNVAFAPEKASGAKIAWRPVTAPRAGVVDLGKIMPGENRVAYMRANIASEQDQQALLELGSDDGLKVWLNGQVVHANNTTRACSPGQDKVNVNLKQGDNILLLKITQGGGEFAAVARLRAPDGKPLSTVMVGAASD